jgi:DNA invertase Pin-like site-specific DNA recombinase
MHHDSPQTAELSPLRPLRCAVYARVSVADTQSRELTSIDLQVEACQRYIESQRGLGWVMVGPAYSDDGVSGATLQRPGLRALLEDVRQDKIDVVLVHRFDRLSRSLFDLTDLIPLFSAARVDLVSVTQPMDIKTPYGRLTLNLLASFAQSEREDIGERTSDKVAATRAKGMWQGSGTPLGYTVDFDQRLVVVKPEAGLVQGIFHRYLSCDTTADLISHLQKHKARNKTWMTRDGKQRGGLLLDRTAVYRILNNRMYIGEALLHGEWHSGKYPPIIDLDLWSQVHEKLAQRARRKGVSNETRNPLVFPLNGRLFWHDGRAYTVFKSTPRGKKHYLYYLAPNTPEEKASGSGPVNLSTDEIHQVVIRDLRKHFKSPEAWLPTLLERTQDDAGLDEPLIRDILKHLDQDWETFSELLQAHHVFRFVSRVTIYPNQVGIQINVTGLIEFIHDLKRLRASRWAKAYRSAR